MVMDELLSLYDWYIRFTIPDDPETDDYDYGYADAIGQCILKIGQALGEESAPYKYEAYKRVMQYDTTANYWKKYPKPIAKYFPNLLIEKYAKSSSS